MAISKKQNKNSAYAPRHQMSLRASCWLTTAPEKEPTTRAVKTFLSSRLIMNSRQLWNSHHRHKFLRAEPSRDILRADCSQSYVYLTKQHGVPSGKHPLRTPGNTIFKTLNFKMSLDASALRNLCLQGEFQSHLLLIISLLLKNFLTALLSGKES